MVRKLKPLIMFQRGVVFIFTIFVTSSLYAQQGESAKITVTDGNLSRCIADSVVRIKIIPNSTKIWTSIKLDWGDDSEIITINQGEGLGYF